MRTINPLELRLGTIPVTRHDATIAGADTALWVYGPASARHSVLLVHGFRGTHHGLLNLVAAMPETRFFAPDLPGFGASEPLPRPHTLANYGHWLQELLGEFDHNGRMHVLGHSFGSMIVAECVQQLVPRRITLVNPIAENALAGPERIPTALAVAYYRLGAALPERFGNALLRSRAITRIMSEVMAVKRSRALRAWIHDEHDAHFSQFRNRQSLLEAFRASVSDDVSAHAKEFPPRTNLVVGQKDAIVPLAASKRLHQRMPTATLHVVEGVGHLVHYEAPFALARILTEILADEEGSA